MGPVFQDSARSGSDIFVIAVTVLFAILFHSCQDKSCCLVELLQRTTIPRHKEIKDPLAKKILKNLGAE